MSWKMTKANQLLKEYQELPEFVGAPLESVNQRGGFNSTPLHVAIYRESPEEVQILLDAKADPNAPGEYGERPLQVAINGRNKKIVEQLMHAGAQLELKDDRGRDSIKIAEVVGFTNDLTEIRRRMAAE
jgi:ankyrin repeat protein